MKRVMPSPPKLERSEDQETPEIRSDPLPPETWLAIFVPVWEQEDH